MNANLSFPHLAAATWNKLSLWASFSRRLNVVFLGLQDLLGQGVEF